jgi:hypothetical protein
LAREHFSAEWIQFVIRNATNQGEMIPREWNHLFGQSISIELLMA